MLFDPDVPEWTEETYIRIDGSYTYSLTSADEFSGFLEIEDKKFLLFDMEFDSTTSDSYLTKVENGATEIIGKVYYNENQEQAVGRLNGLDDNFEKNVWFTYPGEDRDNSLKLKEKLVF
ncbi:hypothetical protein [Natranaerobius thermophilus]|uniref:Uncharacterized protein n=1 Tax=Natranaerobius thermophilus (strain ATCC BAA-1301 / DSM 18059 / JW/NM-WN-LF) TaxID=457570 RepID=B2A5M6_NATTJ|nr:hypothetical protein [Natranaerobius thermophilus]ACB85380.1 hypothetical protein Nther_1808 [Natranaerobius thermophilus JW/NM-WN-LF]